MVYSHIQAASIFHIVLSADIFPYFLWAVEFKVCEVLLRRRPTGGEGVIPVNSGYICELSINMVDTKIQIGTNIPVVYRYLHREVRVVSHPSCQYQMPHLGDDASKL